MLFTMIVEGFVAAAATGYRRSTRRGVAQAAVGAQRALACRSSRGGLLLFFAPPKKSKLKKGGKVKTSGGGGRIPQSPPEPPIPPLVLTKAPALRCRSEPAAKCTLSSAGLVGLCAREWPDSQIA